MKTTSKIAVLIVGIIGLIIMAAHCHAQTNGVALTPPPYPPSTAEDWSKALHDVGVNIDVKTLSAYGFLLYIAVKFARNKTALGQGAIGQFLSSVVNLESSQKPASPPQGQPPKV